MKLLLLILLVSSPLLAEEFDLRLPTDQMGYDRSIYIKGDHNYPMGEVQASRVLGRILTLRFEDQFSTGVTSLTSPVKNVVLEMPARWTQTRRNRIYFGRPLRPAPTQGISSFVNILHIREVRVTFRLTLYNEESQRIKSVELNDTQSEEEFLDSLIQYIRFYSKLGKTLGVEEITLSPELSQYICKSKAAIDRTMKLVRSIYSGRIRMDFESVEDLDKDCLAKAEAEAFGIEPQKNPNPNEISEILKAGAIVSKLSFSGNNEEQFERATLFLSQLSLKNQPVTWGTFYLNPHFGGSFDTSDSPLDKPFGKVLEQWFKSL